jgi:hypothetical protein
MATKSLRERLSQPATCAEAREELRQRILEIVNRKGHLSDMEIWRESAPHYLPWKFLLEELWTLDKEEKLKLEIPAPGSWQVHSLEAPSPVIKPITKAKAKTKKSKAAKRLGARKKAKTERLQQ